MARRTREARAKTKAGKKPSGRESKASREVIHKRAYWFDRSRSLSKLHGWPRADPGDGRGLVGRYTAAIHRPVGELGCAELHLLLTQRTDPHFLVPVALDRLGGGVGIDERALLGDLLRLPREFWRTHPFLCQALRELAAGVLRALRAGEGEGEAEGEGGLLQHEIERFIDGP